MPILATCSCGARFNAKEELAGKQVKCPACDAHFIVPNAASQQIRVACQCGQAFLARPELAGKYVTCPSCAQPLHIPSPQSDRNATNAGETLFELCRAITEDREITLDEIKALRQWLKQNRNLDLPAVRTLSETVERIVADGVVTREEVRELLATIDSVLEQPAGENSIETSCGDCGRKYRCAESFAGQPLRCPSCGGMVIAQPHGATRALREDDDGFWDELDRPPSTAPNRTYCPNCGSVTREGAEVCGKCWYHKDHGRVISTTQDSDLIGENYDHLFRVKGCTLTIRCPWNHVIVDENGISAGVSLRVPRDDIDMVDWEGTGIVVQRDPRRRRRHEDTSTYFPSPADDRQINQIRPGFQEDDPPIYRVFLIRKQGLLRRRVVAERLTRKLAEMVALRIKQHLLTLGRS